MGASEWFWEGNVVSVLVEHLAEGGWQVERVADTASSEPGVDILVRKGTQVLAIEVKGYPSKYYERGAKKGLPKPTNPATQARHWYAEALFKAILRQSDNPSQRVAIAFPDFEVYGKLIRRTSDALRRLDLTVFTVRKSGEVDRREPA